MSLPRLLVLTVPRETDEHGLAEVKRLLLNAVPEFSELDADVLIKMADSARLVDLEAESSTFEHPKCVNHAAWNAALRRIAGGGA